MKRLVVIFTVLLTIGIGQTSNAATFLGPTPYLSFSDSFFSSSNFNYFYLEDFEDGALNTPGVSANKGVVGFNSPYVDSVDGDDGSINGSGNLGHSWALMNDVTNSVTFTFDKTVVGSLPTHVGIVWTDVGAWPNANYGNVTLSPFDVNGIGMGSITAYVGDGSSFGETAEDRFFGIVDMGGISRITLSMEYGVSWELDHLQYGAAPVPVPATILLFGTGLAGLAVTRLRRRKQ